MKDPASSSSVLLFMLLLYYILLHHYTTTQNVHASLPFIAILRPCFVVSPHCWFGHDGTGDYSCRNGRRWKRDPERKTRWWRKVSATANARFRRTYKQNPRRQSCSSKGKARQNKAMAYFPSLGSNLITRAWHLPSFVLRHVCVHWLACTFYNWAANSTKFGRPKQDIEL